jgi:hypothetical protein
MAQNRIQFQPGMSMPESENKVPFVAAVSLTADEHTLRVKLTPVPGFTFQALWDWSRQHLGKRLAKYILSPSCRGSDHGGRSSWGGAASWVGGSAVGTSGKGWWQVGRVAV